MSDGISFLEGLIEERLAHLHTAMPARVESFDPVKMRATVQPLFRRKFKGQGAIRMPLLLDVPVAFIRAGGFVIRPPFRKGDIVLVVFSERAIDNVIYAGEEADPGINRKHALDDAIVVGGLLPSVAKQEDGTAVELGLPDTNAADLVLGKEDFTSVLVMNSSGDIEAANAGGSVKLEAETGDVIINNTGNVYLGGPAANEGVPLGDTLKEWLDNHTHHYTWGDTAGSGTTNPPDTLSPSPSQRVKTV